MRSCSKRSVPYTGASEGYFKQVRAAVRAATRYSMGVQAWKLRSSVLSAVRRCHQGRSTVHIVGRKSRSYRRQGQAKSSDPLPPRRRHLFLSRRRQQDRMVHRPPRSLPHTVPPLPLPASIVLDHSRGR